MSAEALPPIKSETAPTSIDLPAPVSPVGPSRWRAWTVPVARLSRTWRSTPSVRPAVRPAVGPGVAAGGYPAAALRDFVRRAGVTKKDKLIEMGMLENSVREVLGEEAERRMAVLKPLKVVLTNYPEGQVERMEAMNHPNRPELGTREVPLSREVWIEQDDFMEDPPRKFFRLAPGREVRLRWGYFITCTDVVKDDDGHIVELRCTYDPETKGGYAPDGRKVRGTIHWVSAAHAVQAETRLYDRLFNVENPADDKSGKPKPGSE